MYYELVEDVIHEKKIMKAFLPCLDFELERFLPSNYANIITLNIHISNKIVLYIITSLSQ